MTHAKTDAAGTAGFGTVQHRFTLPLAATPVCSLPRDIGGQSRIQMKRGRDGFRISVQGRNNKHLPLSGKPWVVGRDILKP